MFNFYNFVIFLISYYIYLFFDIIRVYFRFYIIFNIYIRASVAPCGRPTLRFGGRIGAYFACAPQALRGKIKIKILLLLLFYI